MLNKRVVFIVLLLAAALSTSICAQSLVWNFLGDANIDDIHDHNKIQVSGRHGPFRAVQLRVTGDAIFFQRVVVFYGNGTSEELVIGHRIWPEGKTHIIDLAGDPRALESVELWYFKEPWEHHPRVSLYGTR